MIGRRGGPWLALIVVLGGLLFIGSRGHERPATLDQRVLAVARDIRCPTCESQSAADSTAPASEAIRAEIRRQLKAGRSPGQIRSFLVGRFGSDILLKPERSGISGLVWAIPVFVFICALAMMVGTFRRWRASEGASPTDDDRAAVARALERT